ncbi:hypothetical protein VOLCADRAFT_116568 [Volvox carteri f. nagariensis]|uniref:Uncharacterized protein n=1 Tax=Volvox carteri f. nagariensis TaxID=3068 RepID=D8TNH2_VOLCA|nr:uncharacterized protein VOLCADRAFT_116568 [Volvox carteri f. nagariensis]EFJ50993.1 hypothetical protein VOLCADRAFT_116568 [Volvox carteri f. nagariensis]|eukprot:XP_002948005.1 hypothetical protein VOLCADRAFT_116568 [Volvox carteri f. nagariensis]
MKLEKEQQDALRKEQYGFASLAKEQQFRSTTQGEMKALNDKVRELTDMLEDRKNANRMLATENQRLKKMCADLQVQLLDKPTARGESAALKAMRDMARQFQNREQMTSAAAENLVSELMGQNQAAMDEMQRLADDRDGLMAELRSTREALSSATSEVAAYREELAARAEEKEALLAEKQQQALEAQQLDEQRQLAISQLESEVGALKQQLVERDAAAEAARLTAEAALRSQKAELEAAALLQRKAAVAELETQVASLKQLLHQAHESLRSLNQTEALEPGWTLMEQGMISVAHGAAETTKEQQMQNQPHQQHTAEPAPPAAPPAAQVPVTSQTSWRRSRSRRSSRAGESVAGSAAADGPVRRSAASSVAGSEQQLQAPGEIVPKALAEDLPGRGGNRAGGSGRPSEAGEVGNGADAAAEAEDCADGHVAAALVDGGEVAAERSKDGGGVGGGERDALEGPDDREGSGRVSKEVTAETQIAVSGNNGNTAVAVEVASSAVGPGTREAAAPLGSGNELDGVTATATAAAADDAGDAAAAANTVRLSQLVPSAPSGPAGNILELLLHDATLHPGSLGLPSSDLWALLRLSCHGLPGLTHLALSAPGSGSGSGSGSEPLPLRCAIRLHFADGQSLLTAVAAGTARVLLQNLRPAVVGAFGCPRVVVKKAAPAAAMVGTAAAAVGDGGFAGLGGRPGRPTRPFQLLSSPWRHQLPDTLPQPQHDEFCINMQTLHRLQADAARASGLFGLGVVRVFIGRGDGHTYQVWRLADVEVRRKATFKALNKVLVEPGDDPWVAAAPLAVASLPLTASLSAPTLTRLELANVRRLLGACRTVAGEKLAATVRITARLARDPEVSEQLLAALQPALQAGAGAPTLPPLHWLSLLGAEELVLERLLREVREGVGAAMGRLMALPAHDDAGTVEVETLGRHAVEAVLLKERQLTEGLASCEMVVAAARAANPQQEAHLARARMQHIRRHVARTLAETSAFFRQRLELYRLGAVTWHFITEAGGGDDPAKCLADVLQALAAAVQALAPPGATAGELLPAGAPLALLLPPPPPAAMPSASPPAPPAVGPALSAAARDLEAALRAAVDAAATAAGEAGEELRKQVAAPGADDVALVEVARARLAALAAPVTAALVGGLSGLCQATVAASLAEPETVAALRDQLLAAAAAAAAGPPSPLALWLGVSGPHLVAQLVMQLTLQADANAFANTGAGSSSAAAAGAASPAAGGAGPGSPLPSHRTGPQLRAALQSLQWLLGGLTRSAPAPVAASPHSVAGWAKASVRMRLQLGVLCTAWSAAAVAAAGHALLLCGQRHAAVTLALEVMGREVDRVLDATKATLESLRANRSYDDAVLADCMPPIATELTSHAAAAVKSCFWLAAQMVLTPLVVQAPRLPGVPTGPATDGLSSSYSSGAGSSSGSCYSSSLHIASCVSFTVVTVGNIRVSGQAPSAATSAAAAAPGALLRPGDPSLAPLTQPLLTTWQPRRAVLYLDLVRLNAAAAAAASAAATAGSLDSAAHAAPPLAPDTAALPHLPAAIELLGWTLRYAEEFYIVHFATRAAAAAVVAAGDTAAKVALSPTPSEVLPAAPSASPLVATTPRESASGNNVPSRRRSASVPVAAADDTVSQPALLPPPSPAPAAALALDPLAALSEAKLAARMAEEADVAIVAGGRLAEAGSLVKWLSQSGMLVLAAADLQQPAAGIIAAAAGSGDGGDDAGVRGLARTLVGLLATHHVQAATVRTLTQPSGQSGGAGGGASQPASVAHSTVATPRPGARSAAATPQASLSNLKPDPATLLPPAAPPSTAPPATPSDPAATARVSLAGASAGVQQPLAVLTYLRDMALAKPALAACGDLAHRVDLTLQALQAAFAAAPPLAPHAAMLARHVSRQLAQQRLLLEGLLLAPELHRTRHPGTVPQPGSVAAAASATAAAAAAGPGGLLWQPWGRVGSVAAVPPPLAVPVSQPVMSAAPSPALSVHSSLGRKRPSLPAMTPKSGGSRHSLLTGGTAVIPVTPPRLPGAALPPPPPPLASAAGRPAGDAYSTESEDEEVGVSKLVPVPLRAGGMGVVAGPRPGAGMAGPNGGSGAAGVRGGAAAVLPDVPDADSDAASIASASTLGTLPGRGPTPLF